MEPIELNVGGKFYTAMPMPDGSFEIFDDKGRLGTITPVVEEPMFVKWVTADLMSTELAQKIGEAIENMEM
jgi:hypothetical protein